jgi:hypothetical protein
MRCQLITVCVKKLILCNVDRMTFYIYIYLYMCVCIIARKQEKG